MPSFLFDISEKESAVARFISQVRTQIQKAFAEEKRSRRITQQAVASAIGVNRSVVNRQLTGFDNLTLESVAELAWAIGWEPVFSMQRPAFTSSNLEVLDGNVTDEVTVDFSGTANPATFNLAA